MKKNFVNRELQCIIHFVTQENPEIPTPEPFTFEGVDGFTIHGLKWLPDGDTKALLIINHGMAEHIARYDGFAVYLASRGIAVFGEDHRGHGRTAGGPEEYGLFSEERGWMNVLGDIRTLCLKTVSEYPGLPLFMMGHSMGSFLTRQYLSLYGSELKGAVISGTGSHGRVLLWAASLIADAECRIKGVRHVSTLLDKLSFGSYNKPYRAPEATGFEWLCSDPDQVRLYVEDPACGFVSRSALYRDLFGALKVINRKNCFSSTPGELPLLVFSGDDDPVGGKKANGVRRVADSYKKSGSRDLTLVLKEGQRHECLNEPGKESLYREIFEWLTARLSG